MDSKTIEKKNTSRVNFEWLFQLIASVAWMVSVFIYGSYEFGDWLQLLAASAWTAANLMNYVNQKKVRNSKSQ